MSERNKELQKLFLKKEYSKIIEIIEINDKEERSSALLNFLGVCKLLRKSKNHNDLTSANKIFLQAYNQEKTSLDGLKACINFINSSADIFDENINKIEKNLSNNYILQALILFDEANKYLLNFCKSYFLQYSNF